MAAASGSTALQLFSDSCNYTHNLNRNFVRADDARNGSEETAKAFTVSKTKNKALVCKSTNQNPRERG